LAEVVSVDMGDASKHRYRKRGCRNDGEENRR
jgi:hypothetical protein